MANTIAIMGESGSGKTTSLRNLDPKTTVIIDCDKKGLNWGGWRKHYSKENKNYIASDNQDTVLTALQRIDTEPELKDIRVVVVDTINGVMIENESRRRKEKGYDKWDDLAWAIWDILDLAPTMRDTLTVVMTAHAQTDDDESGNRFTHVKTSGRKLNKMVPESKIRTVLHAKRVDGEYVFETRSDYSTAKDGMMSTLPQHIPNDVTTVIDALEAFDYGDGEVGAA